VEGRIEDGRLRQARKRAAGSFDRLERRPVVEGRKLAELGEVAFDSVVDQDRFQEALTAVDDAVSDGDDVAGRLFERRDRLRVLIRVDDRQLEAGRTGVDDEDRT